MSLRHSIAIVSLTYLMPNGLSSTCGLDQDCNTNGVPDRCELACGTTGGFCDIPGCGLAGDCNDDRRPDECVDSALIGTDASHLYDIDKNTGFVTRRTELGMHGHINITGSTYIPERSQYYVAVGRELISVETVSGTIELVGDFQGRYITALAYDAIAQLLYGIIDGEHLAMIDVTTALVTPIGNTGYDDVEALAFDPNQQFLYAYDGALQQLLTLDAQTGEATPIGSGFAGVPIAGLAFDADGQVLYGGGRFGPSLYRINTSTGTVSPFLNSGDGLIEALAFDSDRSVLCTSHYMRGKLWETDPSTGVTTFAAVTGFPNINAITYNVTVGVLYGVSSSNDHLLTIDTERGTGHFAGQIGFDGVDSIVHDPLSNTLYGVVRISDTLIVIDPEEGPETLVGDLGTFLYITSLTFDSNENKMYATNGDELMLIDPNDASADVLGEIHPAGTIGGIAMDTNSDTLYGIDLDNDALITIDTDTLVSTQVSGISVPSHVEDLTFDPDNGLLYATSGNYAKLLAIDPIRKTVEFVGMPAFISQSTTYDETTQNLYMSGGSHLATFDLVSGRSSITTPLTTKNHIWGIEFEPESGVLYGSDLDQLVTINPVTGNVTPIGPFGDGISPWGLAFSSDAETLFGTAFDRLVRIDKDTGTAKVVGAFGTNAVFDITFDESTATLYGLRYGGQLLEINTKTGTATSVGQIPYTGQIQGLASISAPQDCNYNSVFDVCDIADGTSLDFNNDGVPNECDFFSDCDLDHDTDLIDYFCFGKCVTGPAGSVDYVCTIFDFDNDADVDLDDWRQFQSVFTGE